MAVVSGVAPGVACVMLACDRPEMSRRAVNCFRRQRYPADARVLIILDTGNSDWYRPMGAAANEYHVEAQVLSGKPIGTLRNEANALATGELIAHWDSDDWYGPDRVRQQVEVLSSVPAIQVTGYNETLFYRTVQREAWRYTAQCRTYCLGASLCYWRETWKWKGFRAMHTAEDTDWQLGLRSFAISAINVEGHMMICSLHGGNTASEIKEHAREWRRVPQYDPICAEALKL